MADLSGLSPEELAVVLEGPAVAPPNGTLPNFDNPSNNNALAHGILALCLALTTVMFLLRLYARFVLIRRAHHEDCKILIQPTPLSAITQPHARTLTLS